MASLWGQEFLRFPQTCRDAASAHRHRCGQVRSQALPISDKEIVAFCHYFTPRFTRSGPHSLWCFSESCRDSTPVNSWTCRCEIPASVNQIAISPRSFRGIGSTRVWTIRLNAASRNSPDNGSPRARHDLTLYVAERETTKSDSEDLLPSGGRLIFSEECFDGLPDGLIRASENPLASQTAAIPRGLEGRNGSWQRSAALSAASRRSPEEATVTSRLSSPTSVTSSRRFAMHRVHPAAGPRQRPSRIQDVAHICSSAAEKTAHHGRKIEREQRSLQFASNPASGQSLAHTGGACENDRTGCGQTLLY